METYHKATGTDLLVWSVVGTILGFGLGLSLWSVPVNSNSYALAGFGLMAGLAVAMIADDKIWPWIFTWLITASIAGAIIGHIVLGWGGAWIMLEAFIGFIGGVIVGILTAVVHEKFNGMSQDEDYSGMYGMPN